MPRLAQEGVVGADAIFACLGPALEIFSRYARVEKASGDPVTLREYLEVVWAAVSKEALAMIFEGADATGFEEDARLTAMWLWTLSTNPQGDSNPGTGPGGDAEDASDDDEVAASASKLGGAAGGYYLEYDAARKIGQGLGAHLERLTSLVEVKGDKARLLPMAERARHLFGKDEGQAPARRQPKPVQLSLWAAVDEAEQDGGWGEKSVPDQGKTVLDRAHQSMILFAAGRADALKRFLVDEKVGADERFWRLAQALSALYPTGSDEKRWVDGGLARKKGLGVWGGGAIMTDSRFENAAGDIRQHMINNNDWDLNYLLGTYLELISGSDEQLLNFLEELVHPRAHPADEQQELVTFINRHIMRDGYTLEPVADISGYPVYRAVRKGLKVEQDAKNLIFAADGPKPEIVFEDAISNTIRIVKNEQYCLVFADAIPTTGLRWSDLVAWWAKRDSEQTDTRELEKALYKRLFKSLASPPEQFLFRTYYGVYKSKLGDKLPALLPQVYLHYDPYTMRELNGVSRLSRQRMDFLLLFSAHERIVIEVDGIQHYAEGNVASSRIYSEMVKADRRLRLSGYEVYRFGSYELDEAKGPQVVKDFFDSLLNRHGLT